MNIPCSILFGIVFVAEAGVLTPREPGRRCIESIEGIVAMIVMGIVGAGSVLVSRHGRLAQSLTPGDPSRWRSARMKEVEGSNDQMR